MLSFKKERKKREFQLTVHHLLDGIDVCRSVGESFTELFAQVVKEAENGGRFGDALGARLRHQTLA